MEGVTPTPALVCMITGSIQEVTADSSATVRITVDLFIGGHAVDPHELLCISTYQCWCIHVHGARILHA